jgi:ring-1,2-phenylacetyl-CoA epoxidase subunit PaaE
MPLFHSLTIDRLEYPTDESVKITFDIPEDLSDEFSYQAGQYINLQTNFNGDQIRRSYSICSAEEEALSVLVKKIPDGVFSHYALNQLKESDELEVQAPEGKFTLSTALADQALMAFAAGSGITPIMSLIKTHLSNSDSSRFILVYGNRSPEKTIFKGEIEQLKKEYPDRFFVQYVFSRSNEEDAIYGHVDASVVNRMLNKVYADLDIKKFYICGPEAMINTVADLLKERGYTDEQVAFELFYAADDDKNAAEALDGKTQVKVILDDEEHELTMDQKDVILDAVLDKDIDAPYSCQGGICSSCVALLKEGEVEMKKNQILADDEVEEGLILTCQSLPKSSHIVVDYDDI